MQVIMNMEEYERLKKCEEELKKIRSCVYRRFMDIEKHKISDTITIHARKLFILTKEINNEEAEYVPQEIEVTLR